MNIDHWLHEISGARDAKAVVAVVTRFLEALEDVEMLDLPEGCRPAQVKSPGDVSYWAFTLAAASLSNQLEGRARDAVGDFSRVFARASSRLASLALGPDYRPMPRMADEGNAGG